MAEGTVCGPLHAALTGNCTVMTTFKNLMNEVVILINQLTKEQRMEGLDILQSVVNSVIHHITGGSVSAVKFVPIRGGKVGSPYPDASPLILTEIIKQEKTGSEQAFEGVIFTDELDGSFHNNEELSQFSVSTGVENPPLIISEVYSTSSVENSNLPQDIEIDKYQDDIKESKKKTAPSLRIKFTSPKSGSSLRSKNKQVNKVKSKKDNTHDKTLSMLVTVQSKTQRKKQPKDKADNHSKETFEADKTDNTKSGIHKNESAYNIPSEGKAQIERTEIVAVEKTAVEIKSSVDVTSVKENNEKEKVLKEKIQALFPPKSRSAKRVQSKKAPGNKEFNCGQCDYKTNVKSRLNSHRVIHTREKKFACKICDKVLSVASSLKRHMLSHKGLDERPHACPVCAKRFCDLQSLRIHSAVHTGERPHKCKFEGCGKTFTCHSNLSRHRRVHTGEMPFVCKEEGCEAKFRDQSSLKLHHLKHTGEKPWMCQFCGMAFKTSSDKVRHERTHTKERNFACKICDKKFVQGWHVNQHMRMHDDERKFKCELCDKRLRTKSSLQHHLRAHAGEKPYTCDICDKSFSTKRYLHNHQVIHTNAQPYKCKTCERSFNQRDNLRRHMRMHSDKIRYTCKYCDKGFKYINSWRYHVQSLHEGVQYTCEKCGASFKCKRTLKEHRCPPLSIKLNIKKKKVSTKKPSREASESFFSETNNNPGTGSEKNGAENIVGPIVPVSAGNTLPNVINIEPIIESSKDHVTHGRQSKSGMEYITETLIKTEPLDDKQEIHSFKTQNSLPHDVTGIKQEVTSSTGNSVPNTSHDVGVSHLQSMMNGNCEIGNEFNSPTKSRNDAANL